MNRFIVVWMAVLIGSGATFATVFAEPACAQEPPQDLRARAETGQPSAMIRLAEWYGIQASSSWEKQKYWLMKAADAGRVDAMIRLHGLLSLHDGRSEPAGQAEARAWLEKAEGAAVLAAQGGDPRAELKAAQVFELDDSAEAVRWLRKAADHGASEAMYALGQHLRLGLGVQEDNVEGLRWTRAAAEGGHLKAMWTLADELEASPEMRPEGERWRARAAAEEERLAAQGDCAASEAKAARVGHGAGGSRAATISILKIAAERGCVVSAMALRQIDPESAEHLRAPTDPWAWMDYKTPDMNGREAGWE